MTRKNNSVKQKNYSQLPQRLSEVTIGQEYQLDVNRNKFVRTRNISAHPDVTHRPDLQKVNLYKPVINRSNSRSKVTEPTDQERQKEINQRTSTVINSGVHKPVIDRSNSRSNVTEPTEQERQKEINQRMSTVINSSVYKPVINRSNSRSKVTEPTEQERQKEMNQRMSTVINSSIHRPVINRNNSRSKVSEPTEQERQKEMNQCMSTVINRIIHKPVNNRSNSVPIDPERRKDINHHASTVLNSNAYEPVINRINSESIVTQSTDYEKQKGIKQGASTNINSSVRKGITNAGDIVTESVSKEEQRETNECPTEVIRLREYQPFINRPDNTAHNTVLQKVTGESTHRSSTLRSRKLYQSIINWMKSTKTVTDSTNESGSADVTQRPLPVRRLSEYQPVINSSTYGATEDNCLSQNGDSVMTQCQSTVSVNQPTVSSTKIVYEANNPVGQRVRGQVTVRPLIIETGSVYRVVINRTLSRGPAMDSEGPSEATWPPLTARSDVANQPASDGSVESDCECRESREVTTQRQESVKDELAYREEAFDARAFCFLYVSALMWVFAIVLWLCK
jgi:hypothetical protein